MQVLVNSDKHIEASLDLVTNVRSRVEHKIKRFEDHLTRIEAHLSDENAHKSGTQDKRCQIEARMKGRDPISVTHNAESLHQAIDGAIDKLSTVLDRNVRKTRVA
ncbi:HPF/RaiA family ribosome-associated protein [Pseudomonas sp. RL_15y_Pfl2_60]|uniref:HPF/RaiA family ribosome-associated protein n=1 Tax=Pseudomonas sp. RL_15y_Pfl2_60 TaxID=3088709 RepID=UPI0030D7AB41